MTKDFDLDSVEAEVEGVVKGGIRKAGTMLISRIPRERVLGAIALGRIRRSEGI
jgi:hypothetical protein